MVTGARGERNSKTDTEKWSMLLGGGPNWNVYMTV